MTWPIIDKKADKFKTFSAAAIIAVAVAVFV